MQQTLNAPDNIAVPVTLTRRGREVLRLVAQGYSDAEIALMLEISYCTTAHHVEALRRQLRLRNRVYLTLYALKADLITLDEIRLPGYEHL